MSYGAPMIKPRIMHYTALLKDRFIVVLGGHQKLIRDEFTGKLRPHMSHCECYDTLSDQWFKISSIQPHSHFTCATVLNERFVYAMPYLESNHHTFYRLDIGNDGCYAKWARNETQKAHRLIS